MTRNLPAPAPRQGLPAQFSALLEDVKARVRAAQTRAMLAVNSELVHLYWDIGRLIDQRKKQEGWGAGVIPRLARELHNELPEVKGFSERNIKLMVQFAQEYPAAFGEPDAIRQPSATQLPAGEIGQPLVAQIPWAHNVLLIQRVKDASARAWYMQQTLANGWSRTLVARITPCLENGKTAYVDFLQDGQVGAGSTEYIILRPRQPLPTIFCDPLQAIAAGQHCPFRHF